MPEGHVIHRYALDHRKRLAGRVVQARSPQGRFSAGAGRINGRTLLDVAAHGKHLFYRFERTESLHVHLGLYGRFLSFDTDPPPPTPATRLALSSEEQTIYLAGPSACDLVDPSAEQMILDRLGPDPLKNGAEANRVITFASNLARRRIPIGAALLDQSVIAGIGNIYRSEALFVSGIDPHREANTLASGEAARLWDTCVAMLEKGLAAGRIVTVARSRVPQGRRRNGAGLYVYQRDGQPCRSCGGPISRAEMANRTLWWCRACQPSGLARTTGSG